jgi:hypothetical protein
MKFLQLIVIENDITAEQNAALRQDLLRWHEETLARGVGVVVGKPLDSPASARTVRVRDGQVLVSDGPFAETKEFLGGIGIIDCASLEEAIEVTASNPIAALNAIELRPIFDGMDDRHIPAQLDATELQHILFVCVDGIPDTDEVEAQIARDCKAWREQLFQSGTQVVSQPLDDPKMVRVRDGETLVTDGPFVETKEFLAGIDILRCETQEEAIGWAAKHPLAGFHQIEVRGFVDF